LHIYCTCLAWITFEDWKKSPLENLWQQKFYFLQCAINRFSVLLYFRKKTFVQLFSPAVLCKWNWPWISLFAKPEFFGPLENVRSRYGSFYSLQTQKVVIKLFLVENSNVLESVFQLIQLEKKLTGNIGMFDSILFDNSKVS
jgi:hypothetical protein